MENAPPPSSILYPRSSLPPSPRALAYDELPSGSDIRREYNATTSCGGGDDDAAGARDVKIVVPAGEPPPAVLRLALFDSLAAGARSSWPLLLLSLILFLIGLRNNRVSGISLAWAWGFFAVFCAALVMLVGWVRYGVTLDSIRLGREQMTVLAATPTRLLVETAGPFGVASYDFPREKIASITIGNGVLRDERDLPRRLPHVAIALADGRTILVLPGRDLRELQWIAAAVNKTLGFS